MQVGEVSNFHLQRVRQSGCYILRTQVDTTTHELLYERGRDPYSLSLRRHLVRVPVLMIAPISTEPELNLGLSSPEDIVDFFNNQIRRQAGTHIFVSAVCRGQLYCVLVEWNGNKRSEDDIQKGLPQGHHQSLQGADRDKPWSLDPLHCAYPCFSQEGQAPVQLLLGLAFASRQNTDIFDRSYTRFHDHIQNNSGQDISPEFIANPSPLPIHYRNFAQFNGNQQNYHRIAFYVCRGARLIVTDMRLQRGKYSDKASRSLYQQGSFVVIFGWFFYNICVNDHVHDQLRPNRNWPFVAQSWLWHENQHPAQRNPDTFEAASDGQTPIDQLRNKVIFLGAAESQFESICWQIRIQANPEVPQIFFSMPDGGIIQDVAPWNAGFALIRARCQYERSWDNVVEGHSPNNNPFQFVVPNEYVIRRIIGIEHNPMKVIYPYEEFDLPQVKPHTIMGTDLRQHFPKIECLDWYRSPWRDLFPPPPEPLYPPIKEGNHYSYLKSGKKVSFAGFVDDFITWSVTGSPKKYTVECDIDRGWPWIKWDRNKKAHMDDFRKSNKNPFGKDDSHWMRESTDRVKYIKYVHNTKSAQKVHNTRLWYLKHLP